MLTFAEIFRKNRVMKYFLTSSPSVSMDGAINPANGFLYALERSIPMVSRCVFITSNPDDARYSDHCAVCMCKAFEDVGFRFEAFDLLDRRTASRASDMIAASDWIILGGGHVPTQNAFLQDIQLAKILKWYNGVVMGISAGSMNCARQVYAQPEEAGEAKNPRYKRYLKGLGLTEVQILPHYYMCKDAKVDGLRVYEDIAMPDSRGGKRFYVMPDGTYLVGCNGHEEIRGELWIIENGVMRKVCENDEVIELPFI